MMMMKSPSTQNYDEPEQALFKFVIQKQLRRNADNVSRFLNYFCAICR